MANGWSADGTQLLFSEVSSRTKVVGTIGRMAFERPSDVKLLVNTGSNNGRAAVSPSGSWIAYDSDLSGQPEIYVERYPELGSRQTISIGGGRLPVWSRNGRELFFSTPDGRQMLAVPVQSETTFGEGRPKVLFKLAMLSNDGANRPYDITPDGTVPHHSPRSGAGWRRHAVKPDPRAELVRGTEAARAGQLRTTCEMCSTKDYRRQPRPPRPCRDVVRVRAGDSMAAVPRTGRFRPRWRGKRSGGPQVA